METIIKCANFLKNNNRSYEIHVLWEQNIQKFSEKKRLKFIMILGWLFAAWRKGPGMRCQSGGHCGQNS